MPSQYADSFWPPERIKAAADLRRRAKEQKEKFASGLKKRANEQQAAFRASRPDIFKPLATEVSSVVPVLKDAADVARAMSNTELGNLLAVGHVVTSYGSNSGTTFYTAKPPVHTVRAPLTPYQKKMKEDNEKEAARKAAKREMARKNKEYYDSAPQVAARKKSFDDMREAERADGERQARLDRANTQKRSNLQQLREIRDRENRRNIHSNQMVAYRENDRSGVNYDSDMSDLSTDLLPWHQNWTRFQPGEVNYEVAAIEENKVRKREADDAAHEDEVLKRRREEDFILANHADIEESVLRRRKSNPYPNAYLYKRQRR